MTTRVAGHTLRNEGQAYDAAGWRTRIGVGRCSCGEESPVLDSNAARKRWHREHKAQIAP